MAKVIAFTVEVNGVQKAITNQEELKKAVSDVKKEFDKADFGTSKYQAAEKELVELQAAQKRVKDETRKTAQEFEVAADKGKRSYRAINAELNNLRAEFRELDQAGRDAFGPDLIQRINLLDTELKDIDASLGQFGRNVGNYSSALGSIGGVDLAQFTSIAGAITGGAVLIGQAGQFIGEFTKEFTELRGELSKVVGEGELDQVTAQIVGIADTFKAETDEIRQAANAASAQLGVSFVDALKLVEEGLLAGGDANGQFLGQFAELAPLAKENGLSAEQFALALTKAGQAGLVAEEDIEKVIVASKGLNGTVAELIDTNNEYVQAQQKTLKVNTEFAAVQNEIAKEVNSVTVNFKNLGTELLTRLLTGFLTFLNILRSIPAFIKENKVEIFALIGALVALNAAQIAANASLLLTAARTTAVTIATNAYTVAQRLLNIALTANPIGIIITAIGLLVAAFAQAYKRIETFRKGVDGLTRAAAAFFNIKLPAKSKIEEAVKKDGAAVDETTKKIEDLTKATKTAAVATDQFAKGSIAQLSEEVNKLKKRLDEAAPENVPGILQKLLKAEEALKEAEEFRKKLRALAVLSAKDIEEIKKLRNSETQQITGSDISGQSIGAAITGLKEKEFRKKLLDEETEDVKKQASDLEKIREESEKTRLETNKRINAEILEEQKLFLSQFEEVQQLLFGSIGTVIQSLSETSSSIADSQISDLERRYEREIELAEGNTEKQEELAAELAKKRGAIEKAEFEQQKRYRVAAAFASLAEGIINILSAPTTIPDPFGTLFKAVRIGILTATTTAQISAINRQRADKGILIKDVMNGNIIGGKVRGATHNDKSKGVGVSLNGMPLLVENGEWFDTDEFGGASVVNKRSTSRFEKTLKGMLGKVFPGKRAMLSSINNYKNYGIPYLAQGAIIKPNVDSVIYRNATGGTGGVQLVAIDPNSVADMAQTNAAAVEAATERGIIIGLSKANRIAERDAQVNKRLGK